MDASFRTREEAHAEVAVLTMGGPEVSHEMADE